MFALYNIVSIFYLQILRIEIDVVSGMSASCLNDYEDYFLRRWKGDDVHCRGISSFATSNLDFRLSNTSRELSRSLCTAVHKNESMGNDAEATTACRRCRGQKVSVFLNPNRELT